MMRFPVLLFLAALVPAAVSAQLVVDLNGFPAGATTTEFDGGGIANCSTGPKSIIDAGFSISSDGAACMPFSGLLNLGDSGIWQNTNLIADASGFTTITIDLGTLASYAGGFMNYAFFFDPDTLDVFPAGNDPMIAALNADHTVLQSYDIFGLGGLGQSSDVNDGRFFGISSPAGDIRYLQISGSGIVMSDVAIVPTPEPSTCALFVIALLTFVRFGRPAPGRSLRNFRRA
jgi:hypothetical protein